MTSDDKFNEVYFKEMLTIEEQIEYAHWMDTLIRDGCACMDSLSDKEIDAKMYRMAQCDINQATRKDM